MKALTTAIMIVTILVSFLAGCATSQSGGSMEERDRVWCERGGGRWRVPLAVCEGPENDR